MADQSWSWLGFRVLLCESKKKINLAVRAVSSGLTWSIFSTFKSHAVLPPPEGGFDLGSAQDGERPTINDNAIAPDCKSVQLRAERDDRGELNAYFAKGCARLSQRAPHGALPVDYFCHTAGSSA